MSDNPEGSLTVWRCNKCGYLAAHPITVKHPRMNLIGKCGGTVERIPVLPLTAVQERERELYEALSELVRLKDGPRDDEYHQLKPAAWDRAREALAAHKGGSDG